MNSDWSLVRIDKILQLQRRWIKLEPLQEYQEIGLRSFGKGIFHKTPVFGADLGDKRVLEIHPGDLIFSNVFAWEGAVGVATEAEKGMIGSHRFVTYTPVDNSCSVEYLQLFFHSPEGLEVVRKVSPGSAGRNRTLNLKQFDKAMIPLPPIAEQRRIVARIEELATKIEEARGLRVGAIWGLSAVVSAEKNSLFDNIFFASYPNKKLGDIADIRSGVTLGRKLEGATITLPYLRVANVQDGYLDLDSIKEVEVYESECKKWLLEYGDLLLTEGGDWDKLGRGTVWKEEIPTCIHQNHIFRLRVNLEEFIPEFLSILISSPYGKEYFQSASKQTTNLATINQRQLKAFCVVQPPIEEQEGIVSYFDDLQAKVEQMKQFREDALKEFDALLPAILDKAFKGEL